MTVNRWTPGRRTPARSDSSSYGDRAVSRRQRVTFVRDRRSGRGHFTPRGTVRQECDGHINDLSAIRARPRPGSSGSTLPSPRGRSPRGRRSLPNSSLGGAIRNSHRSRGPIRPTLLPGSIRRRFGPESGSDVHRPATQAIEQCPVFSGGGIWQKRTQGAARLTVARISRLSIPVPLPPAKCRLARALDMNLAEAAVSERPARARISTFGRLPLAAPRRGCTPT